MKTQFSHILIAGLFFGFSLNAQTLIDTTQMAGELLDAESKSEAYIVVQHNEPQKDTSLKQVQKSATFINTHVPDAITIDVNKTVGEIPFTSEVTPTGTTTVTVPIEVYPGIRDMHPQISFAYNHLAGNGPLGVGWTVGGLSVITRTPKNIYYDGKVEGIKRSGTGDAFLLDGIRLIKVSSASDSIKYESESGNIKVTARIHKNTITLWGYTITLSSSIKYFDVYYPNGLKATFGYASNTVDVLQYPLTSMSDPYGNTVNYEYNSRNNHYQINKIIWANASVEFNYDSRTDRIEYFSAGLKITEDQLLQSVVCKYGNNILKTYNLTYEQQHNSSVLTQIGLTAESKSLNPLRFYYGEGKTDGALAITDAVWLPMWWTFSNPGNLKITTGKLFTESQDIPLVTAAKNSYYRRIIPYNDNLLCLNHKHTEKTFTNKYNDNDTIAIYTGGWNPTILTGAGFCDIICANLDNEGSDRIIRVNNVVSSNSDRVIFSVYKYTSIKCSTDPGFIVDYTRTFDLSPVITDQQGNKSIRPKNYYAGDFNGDGKIEILAVSANNPVNDGSYPTVCYLFDLETNTILYEGSDFTFQKDFEGKIVNGCNDDYRSGITAENNSDKLFAFDYNGDGKTDICHINSTSINIYEFNISSSGWTMSLVNTNTNLNRTDLANKQLRLGDFNGDGIIDLLISPLNTSTTATTWEVYYGMGNGSFYDGTAFNIKTCVNETDYPYVQDINGDGISDLVIHNTAEQKLYTYLFQNNITDQPLSGATINMPQNTAIVPVNVSNREYYCHFMTLEKGGVDGYMHYYSYPLNATKENMLTGTASSFGVINKFYYDMLSMCPSDTYSKIANSSFPYETYSGPLFVTTEQEQFLNGNKIENLQFKYRKAVLHKQGRGFQGFEKFIAYDRIRYRTQTHTFDPFKFGVLTESETPTAKVTNTYDTIVASNKIVKVNLTTSSMLDKLKEITVSNTYLYDNFGNPYEISTNYGTGYNDKTEIEYYNNTSENSYLIGFPTKITKNIYGTPNWSEQTRVESHDGKGQPLIKKSLVNGNQTSYDRYTYNSQGNCTSNIHRNYSATDSITTTWSYDIYGRMLWEKSPVGSTVFPIYLSYGYDEKGRLRTYTDILNYTNTYTYDEFGRTKSITGSDGVIQATYYYWITGDPNRIYRIDASCTGKTSSSTYYDALNRETRNIIAQPNGISQKTDLQYDSYSRLKKVSLPFTGNAATLWNTYNYDDYDRPTSLVEASSRTTSWSYSGKSATTTKDGITSTQTVDNRGRLIQVTDPGGTITYNLRPDGQPTSIVVPGNITTSFEYDVYGRRTAIVDPSAGRQTFHYDAAGNVDKETDATGKEINYRYDKLGRITQKYNSTDRGCYFWYNNRGQLSGADSESDYILYIYDDLGRLIHEDVYDYIDFYEYEKKYTYSAGNISTIEYWSDQQKVATENHYYINGYRNEIKLNGTTSIWKLNTVNQSGQHTSVSTGPVTRSYTYDQFGYPTGRTASVGTTVAVQNLTTEFNPATGNLNWRKRNTTKETFYYDNLNRLTGYKNGTASYDTKGNITGKSDVGTFSYSSSKPYMLTGVQNPTTTAIPQREQTVAYTSFKRPASISENGYTADFHYDAFENRVLMEVKNNGQKVFNRYYFLQNFEIDDQNDGTVKKKLYLGGDYYSAPAVLIKTGDGNWELHYICRDYLGSITAVTNSNGTIVQQVDYDAWGRLRTPAMGLYSVTSQPTLLLGRGYTGHEHLPWFGLINMNARLYDPAVGRFLSPDPYVQAPTSTQNFNRYSYALNNPMRYTDKDGEFIFTLISAFLCPALLPAAISADISWMSEYISQVIENKNNAKEKGYNDSDVWLREIDWFDVGISGATGFASWYAPGVKYLEPVLSNAVDIYGTGDYRTIAGGNMKNSKSGKSETIDFGLYVRDVCFDEGSILVEDILKNGIKPYKNAVRPGQPYRKSRKIMGGSQSNTRKLIEEAVLSLPIDIFQNNMHDYFEETYSPYNSRNYNNNLSQPYQKFYYQYNHFRHGVNNNNNDNYESTEIYINVLSLKQL